MKKILVIIVFTIFLSPLTYGQGFELNTNLYYGVWNTVPSGYFYGGTGYELSYEFPLKKASIKSGLEFRSVDWGNQVTFNNGFKMPYVVKDNWSLNGITSVGLGWALFVDNPLFVWSIGYMPEVVLLKKRKLNVALGVGLRYTQCPAYIEYGSINQVLELPLKVGMKFEFGKKKSKKVIEELPKD